VLLIATSHLACLTTGYKTVSINRLSAPEDETVLQKLRGCVKDEPKRRNARSPACEACMRRISEHRAVRVVPDALDVTE
jgi:hypothetical protein